jgi:hypothetical protein
MTISKDRPAEQSSEERADNWSPVFLPEELRSFVPELPQKVAALWEGQKIKSTLPGYWLQVSCCPTPFARAIVYQYATYQKAMSDGKHLKFNEPITFIWQNERAEHQELTPESEPLTWRARELNKQYWALFQPREVF